MDGQIIFSAGSVILTSRLIEGQFPNYQQLLPDEFKHEIKMDRDELREAVSRISLMAQKNAPLRMKFAPGRLTIAAQTPQVGEAKEIMPVAFQGKRWRLVLTRSSCGKESTVSLKSRSRSGSSVPCGRG